MTTVTPCQVGLKDRIIINDLVLPVCLKVGAQWPASPEKPVEQLVSITLSFYHDIAWTVETEDVNYSINYASLAEELRITVARKTFLCIQDLCINICELLPHISVLHDYLDGLQVRIRISQEKAFLHSRAIAMDFLVEYSPNGSWSAHDVTHLVQDLVCSTIVGIENDERLMQQNVIVNIAINTSDRCLRPPEEWIDVRAIMWSVYKEIYSSKFLTLEALTSAIASHILSFDSLSCYTPTVSVGTQKPSALSLARSAEVHIARTLTDPPTKANVSHAKEIELQGLTAIPQSSNIGLSKVAIALGSNIGDAFQKIEYALRLLEVPQHVLEDNNVPMTLTVVNTSFLYETAPMYVIDQPPFINCACIVETNIPPILLLRLLKKIESLVGRVPSIRNGPRAVDLDVIFYGDQVFDTRSDQNDLDNLEGELVIPHPRVQEREFVLRPLADMIPNYMHPVLKRSVDAMFKDVCDPTSPAMHKVIPFPSLPLPPTPSNIFHSSVIPVPQTLTHWTYPSKPSLSNRPAKDRKTHVMATLNVTPDSFSDGSVHRTLPTALAYACSSVSQGAAVIDVGGYSTRPGAAFVSVEDEINRVVPAVAALRDSQTLSEMLGDNVNDISLSEALLKRVASIPISVDTFRWEVAEAALKAGANCINDVYAFTGPDSWPLPADDTPEGERVAECMAKMKAVSRQYAAPVVLMHSRGDAGKNKDYSIYQYVREQTLEGVRVELGAKLDQIVSGKGGVRRWLVIVDPGIGFSKTLEGNLGVLRSAEDVVADVTIGNANGPKGVYRNPLQGFSQLIGVSRKSFLGAILSQDPDGRETTPKERVWATAAAVTCAVQRGALVIRVHDVREMMDVVKVAELL